MFTIVISIQYLYMTTESLTIVGWSITPYHPLTDCLCCRSDPSQKCETYGEEEEEEEILGSDDDEQEDPHDYVKGKFFGHPKLTKSSDQMSNRAVVR